MFSINNQFKTNTLSKYLMVFLLCFATWHCCTYLQAQNYAISNEYSLKAAYIYKFSQYTDWSNNASTDSFRIVILDNEEIYQSIKKIAEVYKVKDQPIAVYQYQSLAKVLPDSYLEKIHMLYADNSVGQDMVRKLCQSKSKSTLLIGENEDFISAGGHISFYREDNKIKFKINSSLINNNYFKINSQLLRLGLASN
jgi:hypothetical protein